MKDLYSFLLGAREQDSQRHWVIFGVMNVINGGLFGFAASAITQEPLKIVASLLGIGLCVLWILAVRRMAEWVTWWESKLEQLEAHYFSAIECKSPDETEFLKKFHVFRDRKDSVTTGCSTRALGIWIPTIFIVAWSSLLLLSIIPLAYDQISARKEAAGPANTTVEKDARKSGARLSP